MYIRVQNFFMKRITITLCTAAFLFACKSDEKPAEVKVASATEEVPVTKEEWKVVDTATANKNWYAYMTPGKEHQMLAKADGEWTGEMTMWMENGAPPMKTTSTAVNKMIFNGLYQQSKHKSDFGGMPFEGISTVGFDNVKKVFVSSWIDNMGSGMMNMEGTWDEATKTIHFKGKMVCASNGQVADVRETFRLVDDNTQIMEMYGPDRLTGKEYKNMEIKFTRKK